MENVVESIADLDTLTKAELSEMGKELGVTGYQRMKKRQELVYKILEMKADKQGLLFATGILEVLPEGYGFLRGKKAISLETTISMSPCHR